MSNGEILVFSEEGASEDFLSIMKEGKFGCGCDRIWEGEGGY